MHRQEETVLGPRRYNAVRKRYTNRRKEDENMRLYDERRKKMHAHRTAN